MASDDPTARIARERDRYREALEQIVSLPDQSEEWHPNDAAVRIAREALARPENKR